MLLNQADLQSPTWTKLRKHIDERLQEHRIKNDGRLSDSETSFLRGRIAEAKYIGSLSEPDPVIE